LFFLCFRLTDLFRLDDDDDDDDDDLLTLDCDKIFLAATLILFFIQWHKLNELAGTKPMETRIAGNLERQVPLDQSYLGPLDSFGSFSVGPRHRFLQSKCR